MKLRFAIQKKGRLREETMELLKEVGLKLSANQDLLRFESPNYPIEILFLRDDDIPSYVSDQVADIGIVGENLLMETSADVVVAEKLGYAKCRLSIAVPKSHQAKSINDLANQTIATSYPNTLKRFAETKGINIQIHTISGSVEIAPVLGVAEAICDLVSSGSTLVQNGLREIETVMSSQAVLIRNKNLPAEKMKILDNLLFRIRSVLQAQNYKYVMLNAPKDSVSKISEIIPGLKNPTIAPLADPQWVSFASVVKENEFWEVLEKLKACGAQGILIMPIEKMVV